MKIACSSVSFGEDIAGGRMTQLEWLDVCANELEVDGVVFETAHFPRDDGDYVAQLRKTCADLGLTVAGLSVAELAEPGSGAPFEIANALGAPLLLARAPAAGVDPEAWGRFAAAAKAASRSAKERNVTLALRNHKGTLCQDGADLKRIAKDVDSSWLRFAPELDSLASDDAAALLPKSVIALYAIPDVATFASDGDTEAVSLIAALQRFRGFVVLERTDLSGARDAYHAVLERFAALRARALVS